VGVKIYITGRPGIGKSTVVLKVIDKLREKNVKIGGIICPEVRGPHGGRVGFKIVDILTGKSGWLAHKHMFKEGPRIGRYVVNVNDAVSIGVTALRNALNNADVIVIDEVGPMELSVHELKNEILNTLSNGVNVLAVVHYRLRDPAILKILRMYRKYEVTVYNRNSLPNIIAREILS